MRKTTLIVLYAALMLSILFIAVCQVEREQENAISENETAIVGVAIYSEEDGELSVRFEDDSLIVSVSGMPPEYSYQYWAYQRVEVDGLSNNNYIWQIVGAYSKGQTSLNIPVNDSYIDSDGNYLVMVRVKDSEGNFIKQLRGAVSRQDAGQVGISSVAVDGEICDERYVVNIMNGTVRFNIDGFNASNYIFKNGQAIISNSESGVFVWDISNLSFGWYELTFIAENESDRAERVLKVYVYGEYVPSETPVIDMVIDDSNPAKPRVTLATTNADGSAASGEYIYTLTADGSVYKNATGVFDIDLGEGQYGIYVIHGTVRRKNISGIDDECRIWYNYARAGNIQLKMRADTTVIAPNEELIITAEASIGNLREGEKLLYSFVKYDANGWTTIKKYSENPTLNWRPLRQGTYTIYARVMGSMSGGEYEREVARDFRVEDLAASLSGDLSVGVYDYNGNSVNAESLSAKRPYLIRADYTGDEDVVFRFTVWDKDMKLVIARRYSPDNEYSFIARKNDEYVVTVQVISVSGYGYKELDSPITLVAAENQDLITVNFKYNGEIILSQAKHRGEVFSPPDIVTREGYHLSGWYAEGDSGMSAVDFSNISESVTLIPNIAPNRYEVVFHANNGGSASVSQSFDYDESKALSVCPFTNDGKLFTGWAESENADALYMNGQAVSKLSAVNLDIVNVYAVWKAIIVDKGIEVMDRQVNVSARVGDLLGEGIKFNFSAPLKYVKILNSETSSPALLASGGAYGIVDMTVTAEYNGSRAQVIVPVSVFKPIGTKEAFLSINSLDSCSYYLTCDIALGTLQKSALMIRNIDGYPKSITPVSVIDVVGSNFAIDGKGYNLSYTIDTRVLGVQAPIEKEISLIAWMKGVIRNLHVSAKTTFNVGGSHSSFISRVSGRIKDCKIETSHESTNSGLVFAPIKVFEGGMQSCIIKNTVKFSPTLGTFYHMFTDGAKQGGIKDNVVLGSGIYKTDSKPLAFSSEEIRVFASMDDVAANENAAFAGFDFSESGSWVKIYDAQAKLTDVRLKRS